MAVAEGEAVIQPDGITDDLGRESVASERRHRHGAGGHGNRSYVACSVNLSIPLDQLIILDEQHLRSELTEFVQYYNLERPHRTLRRETPVPARRAVEGLVRSRPVLGGLRHVYERVA
ncbi:MAG: transposase [Chloroflexi bacterium]|nr:MAG: transposase [Chloroflexota bacterium]